MLKDSALFLLPQCNNKASTEQKLCNYKYSGTEQNHFICIYFWAWRSNSAEFSTEQAGSQAP